MKCPVRYYLVGLLLLSCCGSDSVGPAASDQSSTPPGSPASEFLKIDSVEFSPDGTRILEYSSLPTPRLWIRDTLSGVETSLSVAASPMMATWVNDFEVLVAVSKTGGQNTEYLETLDATSGSVLDSVSLSMPVWIDTGMTVVPDAGVVIAGIIDPDGDRLALISLSTGEVTRYGDAAAPSLRSPQATADGSIFAIAALPSRRYVHDNDALVAIGTNGQVGSRVTPVGLSVNSFALAEEAGVLFVEGWDDAARYGVWSIGLDGGDLRQVVARNDIHTLGVDSDGQLLALVVPSSPVRDSVVFVSVPSSP